MNRLRLTRVFPAALLVGLALLTHAASGAPAIDRSGGSGIPNDAGIYAGCYRVPTGVLRLVRPGARCRSRERRVTWEKQGLRGSSGVQGVQGVQGATGPQGVTGPRGTTGLAGPQGATGSQGVPGEAGAQGPAGPSGPAGPAGPVGPVGPSGPSESQLVIGAPATSAPAAPRHTLVSATATCPAGTALLGGGGSITSTATQKDRSVIVSSYPSSADTWTAVGVVATAALPATQTMTVIAHALCSQ